MYTLKTLPRVAALAIALSLASPAVFAQRVLPW